MGLYLIHRDWVLPADAPGTGTGGAGAGGGAAGAAAGAAPALAALGNDYHEAARACRVLLADLCRAIREFLTAPTHYESRCAAVALVSCCIGGLVVLQVRRGTKPCSWLARTHHGPARPSLSPPLPSPPSPLFRSAEARFDAARGGARGPLGGLVHACAGGGCCGLKGGADGAASALDGLSIGTNASQLSFAEILDEQRGRDAAAQALRRCYAAFSKISVLNERLTLRAGYSKGGEGGMSRANQYLRFLMQSLEELRVLRDYRTPFALRYAVRVGRRRRRWRPQGVAWGGQVAGAYLLQFWQQRRRASTTPPPHSPHHNPPSKHRHHHHTTIIHHHITIIVTNRTACSSTSLPSRSAPTSRTTATRARSAAPRGSSARRRTSRSSCCW